MSLFNQYTSSLPSSFQSSQSFRRQIRHRNFNRLSSRFSESKRALLGIRSAISAFRNDTPESVTDPTTIQVLESTEDNVITTGNGSDTIVGNVGNDQIFDGGGVNFLIGGPGDDTIVDGSEDGTLIGNEGSDTLTGGAGNDIFEYFVQQNASGDVDTIVDFESGNDAFVIVGGSEVTYENETGTLFVDGIATAVTTPNLDLQVLAREDSFLVFGNGNVPELSNSANRPQAETTNVPAIPLQDGSTEAFVEATALAGGLFVAGFEDQENTLLFGESDDVSVAGNQRDVLDGGAGDDHLAGFGGNDRIIGGFGDDVLQGDGGNDILVGGQGSDLIYGGQGRDIYRFSTQDLNPGELDVILGFEEGLDSIIVTGSRDVSYSQDTGLLSVDGNAVAVIETDLNIRASSIGRTTIIF